MIVLRFIASVFYCIGVGLRNFLYDEKILHSSTVNIPTVCIGNLAVGGTGKTPHTELLAKELSKKYKVAILSLGYKRKTKGFQLADSSSTADTIGDEPLQMHRNLPDVIVAVSKNRIQGIQQLQKLYPDLQLVILDDAFQYRKLKCDINILLTQKDNLYINDHLLPRGRLRDQKHQSMRANVVVVTNCEPAMQPIDRRLIKTKLRIPPYQHLFFSEQHYAKLIAAVPDTANRQFSKPLVVCGIANPQNMIEYIKQQYPNAQILKLKDHQRYGKHTIKRISSICQSRNCDAIITTNKDFVKLQDNDYFKPLLPKTWYLPIEINLLNKDELLGIIFKDMNKHI